MSSYDIMIVGGGPAGLSAAASIVRQDHSTVLFDSGEYRNAKSKHMHTVPTWDHQDPSKFRAAALADFKRYGTVHVERTEIVSLEQRDDKSFEAKDSQGKVWVAKKVILATGVEDLFPDIPGYAECWITGVFHCLYCHGWEEKGAASAGILAEGDCAAVVPALHFARQALRMANEVTLYTHGNKKLAEDLTRALEEAPAPMKVDSRVIVKLVKAPERAQITAEFEDGTSSTEAFLAHKPKTRLRGSLAKQLGVDLTYTGAMKVNPPFNQTNVKGVFAAGDCSNPMHTVTQALHSGTCTGGGAPLQIQAETFSQPALF